MNADIGILGINGYVGSSLAEQFRESGYSVVNLASDIKSKVEHVVLAHGYRGGLWNSESAAMYKQSLKRVLSETTYLGITMLSSTRILRETTSDYSRDYSDMEELFLADARASRSRRIVRLGSVICKDAPLDTFIGQLNSLRVRSFNQTFDLPFSKNAKRDYIYRNHVSKFVAESVTSKSAQVVNLVGAGKVSNSEVLELFSLNGRFVLTGIENSPSRNATQFTGDTIMLDTSLNALKQSIKTKA
jgi:nucleoside-diphosphate-sugar epimerase